MVLKLDSGDDLAHIWILDKTEKSKIMIRVNAKKEIMIVGHASSFKTV
jgi:hypothetical protein